MVICTKCGKEITSTDEARGNYREDMIGDERGLPKVAYKHIRCPGQAARSLPIIDWDTPLPEADPSTWIVKRRNE